MLLQAQDGSGLDSLKQPLSDALVVVEQPQDGGGGGLDELSEDGSVSPEIHGWIAGGEVVEGAEDDRGSAWKGAEEAGVALTAREGSVHEERQGGHATAPIVAGAE